MVKKPILLLFVISLFSLSTEAQKRNLRGLKLVGVSIESSVKVKSNSESLPTHPAKLGRGKNNKMAAGTLGTKIGKTYYDLQTNGASGSRIVRHPDGTISAVWNEECNFGTGPSGYPNRGAGYNYFNGNNWIHGQTTPTSGIFLGTCNEPSGSNGPQYGIASKSVGWPEIIATTNQQELVITHAPNGINLTSRAAKGTGGMASWSTTSDLLFSQNVLGAGNMGAWPRAASNGYNIHLIYALNKPAPGGGEPIINEVSQPFVYNRSVDGGLTWDKQNIFLPGLTGIRSQPGGPLNNPEGFEQIGADNYAIAVNGNTVAIVAGSMGMPWTLWKSVDNGNTFTRRVISKTTPADTMIINQGADTVAFVNDKAHEVLIDQMGMVHVWAGEILTRVATHAGSPIFTRGFMYYPAMGERLLYWNEGMAAGTKPLPIAEVEDSQPLGSVYNFMATPLTGMPYFLTGLVSMPTAAIDSNNGIYVVYSGAVEGISNNGQRTGQPFRDLYVMKRFSSNGNWSLPINISRSLNEYPGGASSAEYFEECIFPSVAPVVGPDNFLHILFQQDHEPGTTIGMDQDPEMENHIMYVKFNITLNTGITENANLLNNLTAYPNPTTGMVNFTLTLKEPAMASVSIKNLLGQEVANIKETSLSTGENQVPFDMSHLAKGIYLYTVTSQNFSVTKKIVKQ